MCNGPVTANVPLMEHLHKIDRVKELLRVTIHCAVRLHITRREPHTLACQNGSGIEYQHDQCGRMSRRVRVVVIADLSYSFYMVLGGGTRPEVEACESVCPVTILNDRIVSHIQYAAAG